MVAGRFSLWACLLCCFVINPAGGTTSEARSSSDNDYGIPAYAFAFAFESRVHNPAGLIEMIGFLPEPPLLAIYTLCSLSPILPSDCAMAAAGCEFELIYALCGGDGADFTLSSIDTSRVLYRVGENFTGEVCAVRNLFTIRGAPEHLIPSSLVWSSCEDTFIATFCNTGNHETAIMRINPFSGESSLLSTVPTDFGMIGAAEPPRVNCSATETLLSGISAEVQDINQYMKGSRWLGNYTYDLQGPTDRKITGRPSGMVTDYSRDRFYNSLYCFFSSDDYTELYVFHRNFTLELLGWVPRRYVGMVVNSSHAGCRLPRLSSEDTLTRAIAIGCSIGGVAIIAASSAGLFLLFRKRKNDPGESQCELEKVSNLTEYDEELSPMLKQCKQCTRDEFPVSVEIGDRLDFNLGARLAPINTELTQTFDVSNNSMKKQFEVNILMPKSHQYAYTSVPRTFNLSPGERKTVQLGLTVLCTAAINTDLILLATHQEDKHFMAVKVSLESMLSTFIDFQELELVEPPIGEGSYGIVYKAKWRNQEVAVKLVKNQQSKDTLTGFENEVQIFETIRCPQIVQFYGAVRTTGKLSIVTEFFPLGNLRSCLKHHTFSLTLKLKCMIDCAKGMKFLHHSNLLHRDLKTDNLLICSLDENAKVNAKISDFGTTRGVSKVAVDQTFTAGIGTPAFMAPEQLSGGHYNQSADVYSFSIMFHQVMTEKEPYEEFNSLWKITEFVLGNQRLPLEGIPESIAKMINVCWSPEPKSRPSFDEILEMLQEQLSNIEKVTND
ncbi:tyrosine protein kinase [Pelomyxa schiedti]|nr:tyrosine protein kinase [Pelomyxa schiedti]